MFSTLLIVLYALVMTMLFVHAAVTLAWMLYTWSSPRATTDAGFVMIRRRPKNSFTLLVPARHEEEVFGETLDRTRDGYRFSIGGAKTASAPPTGQASAEPWPAGASRIYQMDADLSHDPEILPVLRAALIHGTDLAIGSRYVPGGDVVGWPWWRHLLSRGGSLYAGAFLGLPVRDLTGGFKGWQRDMLETIRFWETRSDGYAFQIETTYRAIMADARVRELPIEFTDRKRGSSKMGWPIVVEAIRMVPVMRLRGSQIRTTSGGCGLDRPIGSAEASSSAQSSSIRMNADCRE